MTHTIKHFSLHRIAGPRAAPGAGTELRVVADVEVGVLPLVQVEEAVIRGYARHSRWPHRWVNLSILQDLRPLLRQLSRRADLAGTPMGPPGVVADLDSRPVVNVYDLADPEGCHVFVNQQAMMREGYWDDLLAIQGLLAHEHAHPLAENETIRASRQLGVELSPDFGFPVSDFGTEDRSSRTVRLLSLLAGKLSVQAPREIFANELTIDCGFGDALLHLNRRNVVNAGRSVAGRPELGQRLQQEVSGGTLSPTAAYLLLLIGDLTSYLDLVLEIAPFYRAGRESAARELETMLETALFPHLEPQVVQAYTALREQYVALRADLSPPGLLDWSQGVLRILDQVLAEKGLTLPAHLWKRDE
jgi:hypothetical protein